MFPDPEVAAMLKLVMVLLWVVGFGGFLLLAGAVTWFLMGMDPTR